MAGARVPVAWAAPVSSDEGRDRAPDSGGGGITAGIAPDATAKSMADAGAVLAREFTAGIARAQLPGESNPVAAAVLTPADGPLTLKLRAAPWSRPTCGFRSTWPPPCDSPTPGR